MSFLKKLFGGSDGGGATAQAEDYNGYLIFASPQSDGKGHRICARIEKEIDGEVKTHTMIRADVCQSAEEAERLSTLKAKALIDQQGDTIFG